MVGGTAATLYPTFPIANIHDQDPQFVNPLDYMRPSLLPRSLATMVRKLSQAQSINRLPLGTVSTVNLGKIQRKVVVLKLEIKSRKGPLGSVEKKRRVVSVDRSLRLFMSAKNRGHVSPKSMQSAEGDVSFKFRGCRNRRPCD